MPQMFGRYELRDLLGRGGMGEVYRAFDTQHEREVALKLLPQDLAQDPQFEARFRRESLLAAQLNEPHIIPIHDFGEIDGRLYIDMRLVEGEDLGSIVKRWGPLPPALAADLVRQVASALDAAHARGLVHRDVKPSNIMLTGLDGPTPFAYLVDFGIARSGDQLTKLTNTSSATVGTIAYMAPERINGDRFDQRADVYALACVLYETLTGSLPFTGDVMAIMYAHMAKQPPRAGALVPAVPPALDQVIARGMAKNPDERYPSASAFAIAAVAAASPAPGPAPFAAAGPGPHLPPAFPPPGRPPAAPPTVARGGGAPSGGRPPGPPPGRPPGPPSGPPAGPPSWGGPPSRPGGNRKRTIAIVAAVVVAAGLGVGIPLLAGGGSSSNAGGTGSPTASAPTSPTGSPTTPPTTPGPTFTKGGTLNYVLGGVTVTSWDPQRSYVASDIANEQRLFVRTLVQFGAGSGTSSYTLHPDLATDTGTPSNNATEWAFTLKSGVKWQDGSTITCDDVRYGISRSFSDAITGGPTYAQQFLDIPSGAYRGPYQSAGQDLFDQAVECNGQRIIFHLGKPVPDFNYALTLPAFAPYKKSKDLQAKGNYSVFSSGPYTLQSAWNQTTGGTFVRNPEYDPATDDPSIRRALPDKIVFAQSTDPDVTIYGRFLAGASDTQNAVTSRPVPPTMLSSARAAGARFTDSSSGFVYFVQPNFTRITNPAVRQSLALSTNRAGYVAATGGGAGATPAYGLVPPLLGAAGGYKSFRAYNVPDTGDPAAARAVLAKAKITTPVRLRLLYADGPYSTPQAKALAAGWNKAGFAITLVPRPDLFTYVQSPANSGGWDLVVNAWGPDWPSASTVIPPIYDSSVNLSSTSNGSDIGRYNNALVNAKISQAFSTLDAASRNAQWAALDEFLAKDVAYIPLAIPKTPRLHGARVVNYTESASTSGYPDLGQIGVSS